LNYPPPDNDKSVLRSVFRPVDRTLARLQPRAGMATLRAISWEPRSRQPA